MPSPSTLIAIMASTAAAVMAQSESPYIPTSGISSQCAAFLEDLDSNTELATCSSRLLSATQLFDPSSGSASSISSTQVQSSLSSLCLSTSNSACSEQLITRHLTYFSGNCTPELAANQPVVRSNYDVLYVLYPFTKAVCAKDTTSNAFCATRINDEDAIESASSASSSPSTGAAASSSGNGTSNAFGSSNNGSGTTASGLFIQAPQVALSNLYMHISDATRSAISRLRKRQSTSSSVPNTGAANSTSTTTTTVPATTVNDANALLPNATTFRTTNLPFLFLSGDMGQKQLCTECTKNVLAAYVGFETDYPYGTGLSNSPILGAQASLWNDIGKVCGSGFLSSITAQSGNSISAAPRSAQIVLGSSVGAAALAGIVGFAFVL